MTGADQYRIDAVSDRLAVEHRPVESVDGLVDTEVEVLFAKYAPPREATPNLRWLQVSSAGVDQIAETAPWTHGLTVTNARGAYAVPMAEYIIAAILSVSQRAAERRELQELNVWPESFIDYEYRGVRGKTLVILGYGGVGRETARLATAFGMRIVAVKEDPMRLVSTSFCEPGTGDPAGVLPDEVVGIDGLDLALQQADYLTITAPLTRQTRGLVDRRRLGLLGPEAWIVNISRGAVIDEEALIEALRKGAIGGAWLDVFTVEPLPADSPLWNLPNTVVTPHVSGGNRESLSVLTDLCCENLRRYVAGEDLLNQVDPVKGY